MSESYYTTGGTMGLESPSYVERAADRELYEALLRREYCYVLTSRQMGKSSLMVRTARKLREERFRAAVLDLTSLGQNVVGSSRVDLQACKLEYSIVSPK